MAYLCEAGQLVIHSSTHPRKETCLLSLEVSNQQRGLQDSSKHEPEATQKTHVPLRSTEYWLAVLISQTLATLSNLETSL